MCIEVLNKRTGKRSIVALQDAREAVKVEYPEPVTALFAASFYDAVEADTETATYRGPFYDVRLVAEV